MPRDTSRPEVEAAVRLAQLTARVDQVLALVGDAARRHRANRQLVDLALDVSNVLAPPTGGR